MKTSNADPLRRQTVLSLNLAGGRRRWPSFLLAAGWLAVATVAPQPHAAVPATASFRSDVMAVLSKAGCNAGPCHGNASGKGGFKLSLRGEDPEADYVALTRDVFGRRVNPIEPDSSLILLKPTTRLAHGGGKRFDRDSLEYAILRRWIAGGAVKRSDAADVVSLKVTPAEKIVVEPETTVALDATASLDDGSVRDVSSLAVYEPTRTGVTISHDGVVSASEPGEVTVLVRYLHVQVPVRLAFIPARPGFAWPDVEPRNYVDQWIFAKLKTLRTRPSPKASDAVFLRRAYLDLLGILPTAAEAEAFVADAACDKRTRCVDTLLQRPEFADFWALKWADLLRNEEKALDRKGVELFYRWIRDGIARGKPLDVFVRDMLTARGSTYQNPAANFYRSLRDTRERGETVAQVFLGTRLLCAQCHNHPFDRWTQADYHDWSDLFARVRFKVLENRYPDSLDKHGFLGEQIVYFARDGEAKNPRTGQDAQPRFLGAAKPVSPEVDRLAALARWLTSPENPRFARAQVNRIWYHLMGRGLVDPVDDFRATNPPSHPELLDALTRDFIEHGFDLRHMIRVIMNSHAYQASSLPDETAIDDEVNYSHCIVRRLGAEETLDALCEVAGAPLDFQGYPEGIRAGQIPGVQAVNVRRRGTGSGERFLRIFGKPERLLATEEERSCQTTLGQALQMITGPAITELLRRDGNRLDQWIAAGLSPEAIIDDLYWTALTRAPTTAEKDAMVRHVETATDRRAALEDLSWAVMNAKEFVMRH